MRILFFIILSLFISLNLNNISAKNQNKKDKKTPVKVSDTLHSGSKSCPNFNRDSCKMEDKSKCRMKDKFIDKDGDGLNDKRCQGMGLGCRKRNKNCKNR